MEEVGPKQLRKPGSLGVGWLVGFLDMPFFLTWNSSLLWNAMYQALNLGHHKAAPPVSLTLFFFLPPLLAGAKMPNACH